MKRNAANDGAYERIAGLTTSPDHNITVIYSAIDFEEQTISVNWFVIANLMVNKKWNNSTNAIRKVYQWLDLDNNW